MFLRVFSALLLAAHLLAAADLTTIEENAQQPGPTQLIFYPIKDLPTENAVTFEFAAEGRLVAQQRITYEVGKKRPEKIPLAQSIELANRLAALNVPEVSVRVVSGGQIVDQFTLPTPRGTATSIERAVPLSTEIGAVSANTTEFVCPEGNDGTCFDEYLACTASCWDLEQCRECETNNQKCTFGELTARWTEETIIYEYQSERICGVVNHTLYDEFALYDVFLKKRWTTTYEERFCPYTLWHTFVIAETYTETECFDMIESTAGYSQSVCPINWGLHNLTGECRIFN